MRDAVQTEWQATLRRLPFSPSLVVRRLSRWPTVLPEASREAVLGAEVPTLPVRLPDSPWASVIVPTFNQQVMTRLCLGSLLAASSRWPVEVLVVDNGSNDGTREYLGELARRNPQVRLILNQRNRGFAAANNQAFRRASGRLLVLLNNDTIVAPGWIEALARRLREGGVGLAGCLTNRSGGENEIDAPYQTYGEFLEFAESVAAGSQGPDFDCEMLPLCCAALRRETLDRIGLLDEGYGAGLCEDDDFCLRLRRAGYRIRVAGDCYIHHFGQASMGDSAEYARLLANNRRRFERKWGVQWRPRERRRSPQYEELITRLRAMVAGRVPPGAVVAVLSRGDEELLKLGEARGVHFMQDENGVYWGAHPADGAEAVDRWKELSRCGAGYLLIPETSAWWLQYYSSFQRFVDQSFMLVVKQFGVGALYRFGVPPVAEGGEGEAP